MIQRGHIWARNGGQLWKRFEILLQTGRARSVAREILGTELKTAVANCKLGQNLEELWRGPLNLLEEAAASMPPRNLIDMLTRLDQVEARGIPLIYIYALLLAFMSEGCILHPLSLWRGLYPGSGVPPQIYLGAAGHPTLLTPERSRDARQFGDRVDRMVAVHRRESVNRAGLLLLNGNSARLADLDV